MTPRVLMLVPTLGERLQHLKLCLGSIVSQGVPGLDIVLVVPDSPEVAALAVQFGARVIADPGRGMSGALNAGFDAAEPGTAYVAWLGDDDLLSPGSLAATTIALDADPDASMVYGWCDYIDEAGTVVFSSRAGRIAGRGPPVRPQPCAAAGLSP